MIRIGLTLLLLFSMCQIASAWTLNTFADSFHVTPDHNDDKDNLYVSAMAGFSGTPPIKVRFTYFVNSEFAEYKEVNVNQATGVAQDTRAFFAYKSPASEQLGWNDSYDLTIVLDVYDGSWDYAHDTIEDQDDCDDADEHEE